MMKDNGHCADAPGSRASHEAATSASSPKTSIPNARPSRRDPAIIEAAVTKLAQECAKWDEDGDASWWAGALADALRFGSRNGYELARYMDDRFSISPDSELVEILDSADSFVWVAHREAVKAWVAEVGFTPKHKVGERVHCDHGIGPIHSIDHAHASYIIDVDGRGNGGYVISAEDVMPAEEAA